MNYCTQNDIAGDQNNNYYPVLPQNGAAYPPGTLAHQIFNYSSTNPNGAVNNPQTYCRLPSYHFNLALLSTVCLQLPLPTLLGALVAELTVSSLGLSLSS